MLKTATYSSLVVLAIFGFVLQASKVRGSDQPAVERATKSAQAWLKLLDSGDYKACYEQASPAIKDRMSEDAFVSQFSSVLQPLGALQSRKLKLAKYTTSLPGAPDGQYVVIQYDSSFANKQSAVETVTPALDKDGQWRVSGYYIR